MPIASDPVVRACWHPVARADGLPAGAVRSVRVMGEDFVLWRGSTSVHVWQDLCVHRGVKLSLGTVAGCHLRCAYHGWTYNEVGRCVAMPAHPGQTPPPRARAAVFSCVEDQGVIWMAVEPSSPAPPFLPEAADRPYRAILCGPYAAPAGAPRVIENFLDVAHLPVVHAGSLGTADHAEIAPYTVDTIDGRPVARHIRIHQPDPDGAGRPAEVSYEYGVLGPFSVYLRKHLAGADRFALHLTVTPVDETESLAWFTIYLNYGSPSDDPDFAAFQEKIFAQDLPIIASQRPERLPLDLAAELHLPSDRLAIAYRQYIRGLGLTFGTA